MSDPSLIVPNKHFRPIYPGDCFKKDYLIERSKNFTSNFKYMAFMSTVSSIALYAFVNIYTSIIFFTLSISVYILSKVVYKDKKDEVLKINDLLHKSSNNVLNLHNYIKKHHDKYRLCYSDEETNMINHLITKYEENAAYQEEYLNMFQVIHNYISQSGSSINIKDIAEFSINRISRGLGRKEHIFEKLDKKISDQEFTEALMKLIALDLYLNESHLSLRIKKNNIVILILKKIRRNEGPNARDVAMTELEELFDKSSGLGHIRGSSESVLRVTEIRNLLGQINKNTDSPAVKEFSSLLIDIYKLTDRFKENTNGSTISAPKDIVSLIEMHRRLLNQEIAKINSEKSLEANKELINKYDKELNILYEKIYNIDKILNYFSDVKNNNYNNKTDTKKEYS